MILTAVCLLIAGPSGAEEPALPDGRSIEQVIVTGTRIQKSNLLSVSPITQLNATDIRLSGLTRVEDLMKNLPQISVLDNSTQSNEPSGTATISLRNLGPVRTLVLVDGRRLPQGSPYTPGRADINQIPAGLLERVEVLTGGASAVYGSDAIAGVVNFYLKDNFEGLQLDYQFSQYSHDNEDGGMHRLLEAAGEPVPSGTERDGDTHDFSLLLGRNFNEERGNLTAYLSYRDIDAIGLGDRDFSACPLNEDESGRFCTGSRTIGEGLFLGNSDFEVMVQGNEFVPYDGRRYNYNPPTNFQRPDERWAAGLNGQYTFSDRLTAYTQLMYSDDETVGQIAPSGTFGVSVEMRCDNPMLSTQQVDTLCTGAGLGANDTRSIDLLRRNVEGGPRQQEITHEMLRAVFGIEGRLNDSWRYDLYALYAEVDMQSTNREQLLRTPVQRSLDAVTDPATNEIVCRSALDGSDPDCKPWNIFTEGAVSTAAIDYVTGTFIEDGSTEQTIVSGYVAADLMDYGLVSPWAQSAAQLILGVEYRDEDLKREPDATYLAGESLARELPQTYDGGYDVVELYTEISLPLAEAKPWAESLDLELGYRYSDYSEWDDTHTYKLGASWAPSDTLRFRASRQRAERVPNISEQYARKSEKTRFGFVDPCAGLNPARPLEECAYSGVTAEQYGSIFPLAQANTITGGNPALEPEKSDTYSLGVLYSPAFIDGLSISLDWYEIKIEDAILGVEGRILLESCLDSGDPFTCGLINRDAAQGTLWRDDAYLDTRLQNLGYLRTRGYDFILDASFDAGRAGSFVFNNILGYVDEYKVKGTPAVPAVSCKGLYGGPCPTIFELRNYLRVSWLTPWDLTVSALWRYFDDVQDFWSSEDEIESFNYIDLAMSWDINDSTRLRLGINNLFDESPPMVVGWGDVNTIGSVYDPYGQYWFAGLTVNFD